MRVPFLKKKTHWLEVARWSIFIGYLSILYWMARHLWHSVKFFSFLAVFITMPVFVFILLRYLQKYEPRDPEKL